MRAGPDLTGPVVTIVTKIRVNGVERPATDWSFEEAISADVPNALDGGELVASRGRIKWQGATGTRVQNPFLRTAGWPPSPGDRVTIDQITTAGGQVQTCRLFSGKIDRTPGGVAAQNESVIVDDIDLLRREVNLRPMQFAMPSDDKPGGIPSGIQLSALTPVVQALREVGFYSTPPIRDGLGTVGQGTLFPVQGLLARTGWQNREVSMPERTTWGMATHVPLNRDGTVAPAETHKYWGPSARPPSPSGTPWWFAVDFPRWEQTLVQAVLIDGFDDKVTLSLWRVGDGIQCFLNKTRDEFFGPNRGAPKATLPIPADQDVRVVGKITYTPNLTVELRGSHAPDSSVTAVGGIPSTAVDMAMIRAWQGVVGAMHLTYGTQYRFDDWLRFEPNAIFEIQPYGPYSSLGLAYAHPQMHKQALEIVKDAASSLVACIWMDEESRFHWADAEVLNRKAPVLTVDAGRILDLNWDDPTVRYRRVGIKWNIPLLQGGPVSPSPSVIVWRGPGSTMEAGESSEAWVKPENDNVDWVVVDQEMFTGDRLSKAGTGQGSTLVGTRVLETPPNDGSLLVEYPSGSFEKVDWETYKLRIDASRKVSLRTPKLAADGKTEQGDPMPQVCAWGRTEWVETIHWSGASGPAEAADYVHEAGKWIQSEGHATALRVFLEPRVTQPRPVINDVGIVSDARLQRGDKIRLEDAEVTGLAVEGVIYRISHSGKAGEYTQRLSLWVTQIDAPSPTYQQVQDYYDAKTYAQLQALKGARSYAADSATPIV